MVIGHLFGGSSAGIELQTLDVSSLHGFRSYPLAFKNMKVQMAYLMEAHEEKLFSSYLSASASQNLLGNYKEKVCKEAGTEMIESSIMKVPF